MSSEEKIGNLEEIVVSKKEELKTIIKHEAQGKTEGFSNWKSWKSEGMESSTMGSKSSSSPSNCIVDNIFKDKLNQEPETVTSASSSLYSDEDKAVDTMSLKENKSDSITTQEVKTETTNSDAEKPTDTEQTLDTKIEIDFQPSSRDEKDPSSIDEKELSSIKDLDSIIEVKNSLSSNLSTLISTKVLTNFVKEGVCDKTDMEVTVVSTSTSPNFIEGTEIDVEQKIKEKNDLDNEKDSSNYDTGVIGSEENSNISDVQETKSGFDSTDSTNDVDSFITQQAVQTAIELMEEETISKNNENSSLNTVESTQHKDLTVNIETGVSNTSKIIDHGECANEKFTNDCIKDDAKNVVGIESKEDGEFHLEKCSKSNKKDMVDEIDAAINKEITIVKINEEIKDHDSTQIDNVGIFTNEGNNATEIEEDSSLNLVDGKTKRGSTIEEDEPKVERDEKKENKLVKSGDQGSLEKNELVKKSGDTIYSDTTETKETSVCKTPSKNTPELKESENILCNVTHKSSTPIESRSKTDNKDTRASIEFSLSKDVPDKRDSMTNPENCAKQSISKASELLQSSSRVFLETVDNSTANEKETENKIVKNIDDEIMDVDEPTSFEKELCADDNTQLSKQEVQKTVDGCTANEKKVLRDTDNELMEVNEETQFEKELCADDNTQLLTVSAKNETESVKSKDEMDSLNNSNDSFPISENKTVTLNEKHNLNSSTDETISKKDITELEKPTDTTGDENTTSGMQTITSEVFESGSNEKLESKTSTIVELNESVNEDSSSPDLITALRSALAKNEEFRRNMDNENKEPKVETVDECGIELICLDDDDVEIKRPPEAALCVNPNCMSGVDLQRPAMFVLTYFKLKKAKNQRVCAQCFNLVANHQEKLAHMLKRGIPLYTARCPDNKDVVLLDSDEEENNSDNESVLSDDTMMMVQYGIEEILPETLVKYRLDHQIRESCYYLNETLDRLEEEAKEVSQRYNSLQSTLDEFRKAIYDDTQQQVKELKEVHYLDCEIPPMPVIKSKLQNMLYNQELARLRKTEDQQLQQKLQEQQIQIKELLREREETSARIRQTSNQLAVATKMTTGQFAQPSYANMAAQDYIAVTSEQRNEPPLELPPQGVLQRPKLKVGELAFTMKVSYFSLWVPCRVLEVIPRNITESDTSTETYRVKMEHGKKSFVRTVTGKYLAYPKPANVQLRVGTRVIAIFKEEEDGVPIKNNYYVGVIAEPPKSTNKYRYLVFFDDGYTQYCPHSQVLVVCHTSKNVWEDIHPEPRDFIKNYLQQYPERPMVKMSCEQVVKVEWKGKWWIVRVVEVDGSLVKVHFDADGRTEWIYRGSTRLAPMYQELAAAKERQSGSLLRTRGFGAANKSDMPYVEYTRGDADEKKDEEKEGEQPVPVRSVARKSTAKKSAGPIIANIPFAKPLISHVPQGTVKQKELNPLHSPVPFRAHQCTYDCIARTKYSPALAKSYAPLLKPLMFGFSRLAMSYKGKTAILYRGPCGRMLRTYPELLRYLQVTKSKLTIDLFDFDFWVNPLHEFEGAKSFCRIEDLSYGKENVPISCVNELDHSMPPYVQYMTDRRPANDVVLNLDPEFLVGCDCEDDCEDRDKCSCWQLTMQGKAYIPDGDLDPLFGYQYRRLPERIATGIYECNSKCKCSATCQNRVAQQPLSCQLQLFKTVKKGWGIRCLHDISKGAFVCIYAGFLLTEQEANEGGKAYGDEYLAELDYIESVENLKEGYEQEAKEMTDDEEEGSEQMDMEYHADNSQSADSDNDFEDSLTRKNREDIRLRLRKRIADDSDKESKQSKNEDEPISISDDEAESGRCRHCRCLLDLDNTVSCQRCIRSFHVKCTPLKKMKTYLSLRSKRKSWICHRCNASGQPGSSKSSDSSRDAFQDSTIVRRPQTFNANITVSGREVKYPSVRELYGKDENVYIMDAKTNGNIGRYLNHSCSPNVFVQNVFVDTHDLRFPWVAFFANQYIGAGTELTWDYNYDVGSVPGKVMLCYCNNLNCRGRLL